MAELLKQQHNLAVLQLSLDRSKATTSSPGCTLFTLEVADQKLMELSVDCGLMNVPNSLREARAYHYSDPPYTLPVNIMKQLQEKVSKVLEPGVPLWLQLTNDCGILALVPWERLLQPLLGISVLRLPYYAINPFSPTTSPLDIVLCASMPETKEAFPIVPLLDTITRRMLEATLGRNVTIHIFTNEYLYPSLRSILQDRMMPIPRVILYNPADPMQSSESVEAIPGMDNSWLLWIMKALHGRSADVLHFICHGYVSADQGAIAFSANQSVLSIEPSTPPNTEERALVQFVEPQQLATFATQLGAWSIGFSSPERNYSEPGLRLLVDQLARLRAGSVLFHEIKADPDCLALGATYRFLYDIGQNFPFPSPALALYCHPSRVKQLTLQPDTIDQADMLNQYTLAKGETLKIMESNEVTPNWVASSQRYLEQSMAEMLKGEPGSSTGVSSPTRKGVEDALSFLSNVLESHASSTSGVKENPQ